MTDLAIRPELDEDSDVCVQRVMMKTIFALTAMLGVAAGAAEALTVKGGLTDQFGRPVTADFLNVRVGDSRTVYFGYDFCPTYDPGPSFGVSYCYSYVLAYPTEFFEPWATPAAADLADFWSVSSWLQTTETFDMPVLALTFHPTRLVDDPAAYELTIYGAAQFHETYLGQPSGGNEVRVQFPISPTVSAEIPLPAAGVSLGSAIGLIGLIRRKKWWPFGRA